MAIVTLAVRRGRARRPAAAGLGVPRSGGRGAHHQGQHLLLDQVALDRRGGRRPVLPARVGGPVRRDLRPPASRRRARRPSPSPRSARPWATSCRGSSTPTSSGGAAPCRSTPWATSTGWPGSGPQRRPRRGWSWPARHTRAWGSRPASRVAVRRRRRWRPTCGRARPAREDRAHERATPVQPERRPDPRDQRLDPVCHVVGLRRHRAARATTGT